MFNWSTGARKHLEAQNTTSQVKNETEHEQTLRLFEECMEREHDESQHQMQGQRQATRRYWMELEVETEVPLEVLRKVPSDVRAEMYRLVDKVWSCSGGLLFLPADQRTRYGRIRLIYSTVLHVRGF